MPPTVAACQLAFADLDVAANVAAVESRVVGLPDRVDVAVFPEHTLTGFVADERIDDVALPADDGRIDRLQDIAAAENTALVVGFIETDGEDLYNTTLYLAPDGTRARYRKRHLWSGEEDVLVAGEELTTVETPAGTAGLLTCYDLNFVDDSAELTRRGIDILFVSGAWPGTYSENWTLLVRARALDGVRWAVGAGRTGRRDIPDASVVEYAGRSLVARPDGGIHATLDRREGDLVADLDGDTLAAARDLVGVSPG
ncbi:carbon-nitrogen hydrolase family protein [Halobellus ordinarius]|uniref:carbon-nitrogen hydrolase family protein n=1 Tax=Halobellus ordinarius TaxID=3075120 RepID=UPI0028801859|nr:carbon-nitrogen hydrolase family protein [Halobellus sp. ZY16]